MSSAQGQIARLRKELQLANKELQEVLAQNEQYKNYIESLLEYNNKLVTIIQKELKVGSKVESNLQPISERTENDSQMISDNRSLSIRGIKHSPNNTLLSKDDQQPSKDQRNAAKLQLIQEEPQPKPHSETHEFEVYKEIQDLITQYQSDYLDKRDEFSNTFKEIIYNLEDEKQRFSEHQDRTLDELEAKTQELRDMMREVKSMGAPVLLSRIAEKSKKVAQDVSAIIDRNRRK